MTELVNKIIFRPVIHAYFTKSENDGFQTLNIIFFLFLAEI